MKIFVLLLVITLLSGCASGLTKDEKLRITCESAASTMRIVAEGVRAGKISAAQKAEAIKAGEALQPICNPGGVK